MQEGRGIRGGGKQEAEKRRGGDKKTWEVYTWVTVVRVRDVHPSSVVVRTEAVTVVNGDGEDRKVVAP